MSANLRSFWSVNIAKDCEHMIEVPYGYDVVITEVALACGPVDTRVTLTASVETLLMDQPKVNGEEPSREYECLLVSFLPNEFTLAKRIQVGFTSTDIAYIKANGAPLVVSGYTMKSSVKMGDYAK